MRIRSVGTGISDGVWSMLKIELICADAFQYRKWGLVLKSETHTRTSVDAIAAGPYSLLAPTMQWWNPVAFAFSGNGYHSRQAHHTKPEYDWITTTSHWWFRNEMTLGAVRVNNWLYQLGHYAYPEDCWDSRHPKYLGREEVGSDLPDGEEWVLHWLLHNFHNHRYVGPDKTFRLM